MGTNVKLSARGRLAISALSVLFISGAFAREVPAPPRRELIQCANLIVQAEVKSVEPHKKHRGMLVARFRVLDTLRGAMDVGATFELSYFAGPMCPEPPKFYEREQRILLLSRSELGAQPYLAWGRHAAWRGTVSDVAKLRRELRSVCPFLDESDPQKRRSQQVEWLMRRVADKRDGGESALIAIAACSEPKYADLYRQKQAAARRGDAAAHRWLDAADVPISLANDLSAEQREVVRRAIDRVRASWKVAPAYYKVVEARLTGNRHQR